MASSKPHGDKKDEPLLNLDDDSEGGASRNSLQGGDVDIQEWERRLVTGRVIANVFLTAFIYIRYLIVPGCTLMVT